MKRFFFVAIVNLPFSFPFSISLGEVIPEFELDLSNSEKNGVFGFFGFVSPSFVHGDEQVEAVVLIKQISDIHDARDPSNAITMRLLPDGTGVYVEETSMPFFMTSQIKQLYAGSCESTEMATAFETNHTIIVNAMRKNQSRMKNKYVLKFSRNIVCKMGILNPKSGNLRGNVHVTRSIVTNKNGGQIPFTHVSVRFQIVICTPERKLLKDNDANGTNNIEDLLAGMSF